MTDDETRHRRVCLNFVAAHGAPKLADYERVYAQIEAEYPGDLVIVASYPVNVDSDLEKLRERIRASARPGVVMTEDDVDATLVHWQSVQAETINRWTQVASARKFGDNAIGRYDRPPFLYP